MTIQELYKFMVKNKIARAKFEGMELELMPEAFLPKPTKKQVQEYEKQINKFEDIDTQIEYWSVK